MCTVRILCWSFLAVILIGCSNTSSQTRETGGESPAKAAAQSASNTRFDFEDTALGQAPAGWMVEATHPASDLAQWLVVTDPHASSSGNQVLSVKIPEFGRGTFNLLWTDQISFQDGAIELKVRAGTGEVDQGGGPIWRVRDRNNYYIARWNPLEDNFRVYSVKDGKRVQLGSADVDSSTVEWHSVRIEQDRNRISGFLDGKKLLDVTDSTFKEGGGVGFWTKADAASFFDDLVIERRETR